MIRPAFVAIVTLEGGERKFLGRDENSGGYPWLADFPQVMGDTNYFRMWNIEYIDSRAVSMQICQIRYDPIS